jgi:DNA-binding Xre family transcriptional regulator
LVPLIVRKRRGCVMPVVWKLKKWLAVERDIYRPSELQTLLAEKAGVQLSIQALSALINSTPGGLRFQTVQALCNALNCELSDFCRVLPDSEEELAARGKGAGDAPAPLYRSRKRTAKH